MRSAMNPDASSMRVRMLFCPDVSRLATFFGALSARISTSGCVKYIIALYFLDLTFHVRLISIVPSGQIKIALTLGNYSLI